MSPMENRHVSFCGSFGPPGGRLKLEKVYMADQLSFGTTLKSVYKRKISAAIAAVCSILR